MLILEKTVSINDLSLHLKKLEKGEQCQQKELIMIKAKINEIENENQKSKSMKPTIISLKKKVKLVNLQPNCSGKRRQNLPILEMGEVTLQILYILKG